MNVKIQYSALMFFSISSRAEYWHKASVELDYYFYMQLKNVLHHKSYTNVYRKQYNNMVDMFSSFHGEHITHVFFYLRQPLY